MEEGGRFFRKRGATEDNFKSPFVVIAPKRIEKILSQTQINVASHLDIMPTVLDLLEIVMSMLEMVIHYCLCLEVG